MNEVTRKLQDIPQSFFFISLNTPTFFLFPTNPVHFCYSLHAPHQTSKEKRKEQIDHMFPKIARLVVALSGADWGIWEITKYLTISKFPYYL